MSKKIVTSFKVALHTDIISPKYFQYFNIKKHTALVLKKIIVFCVFKTNLNKAVNVFCTQPEWIRNIQMIQYFSTIKTWMRILHD